MHAGMYLCIHSFIHACCSYLRSSHFPLGNVLGFGDKTVNGMSQEVEVLPRMSRKYYILVRFEEKYFLNTESFNVVFLPNYLQRSFFFLHYFQSAVWISQGSLCFQLGDILVFLPNVLGNIFSYFLLNVLEYGNNHWKPIYENFIIRIHRHLDN